MLVQFNCIERKIGYAWQIKENFIKFVSPQEDWVTNNGWEEEERAGGDKQGVGVF